MIIAAGRCGGRHELGSAQWMVCVLQNSPHRLGVKQSIEDSEWQMQRLLHLSAVAHAAEINAMMAIAATRGRQVGAERWFLRKIPLRIDTFVFRNSYSVHLRFSFAV
jgi:hypothetical protein